MVRLIAIALTLAFAAPAFAGEAHPAKPMPQTPKVALYRVPSLTEDLAKTIVKALAVDPGVLGATPSLKDSTLAVTFDANKTTPERIHERIGTVAEASLVKVSDAPPTAHGGCGRCPSRRTCPSAKE